MEKFNKFSISELNTGISILEALEETEKSEILKKEIESRTSLPEVSISEFKEKYLGKYVKYKGSDDILFFRIDEIVLDPDLDILFVQSKLIIIEYSEGYIDIQYTSKPSQTVNINPHNLDLRDFVMASPEEFKATLNKIINDGLAIS